MWAVRPCDFRVRLCAEDLTSCDIMWLLLLIRAMIAGRWSSSITQRGRTLECRIIPTLWLPSSGELATSRELQMDRTSCTAGEKLSVSIKLHHIHLGLPLSYALKFDMFVCVPRPSHTSFSTPNTTSGMQYNVYSSCSQKMVATLKSTYEPVNQLNPFQQLMLLQKPIFHHLVPLCLSCIWSCKYCCIQ